MYEAARACIEENRAGLDALTEALLERETLDGDEVRRIVAVRQERLAA
jgi:cell division protease FtsH